MININGIRELYKDTSSGDWTIDDNGNVSVYVAERNHATVNIIARCTNKNDAEFIMFVHDIYPVLLDEIERLQEENKSLKKNLAECAGY